VHEAFTSKNVPQSPSSDNYSTFCGGVRFRFSFCSRVCYPFFFCSPGILFPLFWFERWHFPQAQLWDRRSGDGLTYTRSRPFLPPPQGNLRSDVVSARLSGAWSQAKTVLPPLLPLRALFLDRPRFSTCPIHLARKTPPCLGPFLPTHFH